jgi:uncharacterized tellurite resistance protein B-like protein
MSENILDKLHAFFNGEPVANSVLLTEALLMTLARVTSVDSNIHPCEVETVIRVIKDATGADVSAADVRVAARSELFESAPLTHYLSKLARKLDQAERAMIAHSLARVIKSDCRVSHREVEFFDDVADALKVGPSALAGLIPEWRPGMAQSELATLRPH